MGMISWAAAPISTRCTCSILAQAVIDKIDDARWYGEAEAFTASALGKNKSVDADDRAVHIDQRASAIARVDGGVGLDVGHCFFRMGWRATALTTPMVTEFCKPSGLPIANTSWPTRGRWGAKGSVGRSVSSILSRARSVSL